MVNIEENNLHVERVDDLPVVYGLLEKLQIQAIVDSIIHPHGNWQGLSPGWVMVTWLMHILTQHTHRMDCVQAWVSEHLHSLQALTGQAVTVLDFTDDRLAMCLRDPDITT